MIATEQRSYVVARGSISHRNASRATNRSFPDGVVIKSFARVSQRCRWRFGLTVTRLRRHSIRSFRVRDTSADVILPADRVTQ